MGYALQMPASIDYFISNRARISANMVMIYNDNSESTVVLRSPIYDNYFIGNSGDLRLASGEYSWLYASVSFNYAFF
ncbi:MAG: hypothetical protein IPN86_14235 [Saprospiraceae bacterium]|nr:hypothetical protein [Saprospiraceae bacterium]